MKLCSVHIIDFDEGTLKWIGQPGSYRTRFFFRLSHINSTTRIKLYYLESLLSIPNANLHLQINRTIRSAMKFLISFVKTLRIYLKKNSVLKEQRMETSLCTINLFNRRKPMKTIDN
jgi:hypothetical protein